MPFTEEQVQYLDAFIKGRFAAEFEQIGIITERLRAIGQLAHYARPDMLKDISSSQISDMLNRIGESIENLCDQIGEQLSSIEG